MQIGLLQAGHLPEEMQAELGDYPELYGRLLAPEGITLSIYPVVDGIFPDDPGNELGWLVSGSRHGAYEDLDWIPRLEDFLRTVVARGIPLVGVCFGHQIIAQALGGRVEKFTGGWGVGRHAYDWGGETLNLNAWHQDQVVDLPENAEILASSPFCEFAALAIGDNVLTVQAHPEFDRRETEMLLDLRAPGVVPPDRIAKARAGLDAPADNREMARRIADFFSQGAKRDRVA